MRSHVDRPALPRKPRAATVDAADMNFSRISLFVAVAMSGALGLASACRPHQPTRITNSISTASAPSAEAYERGDGVPRDYARAFERHVAACGDGHGDLVACDMVLDAIHSARGTANDDRRFVLQRTYCAAGDDINCLRHWSIEWDLVDPELDATAASSPKDKARRAAFEAALSRIEAACEGGNGRACAAMEELNLGDVDFEEYSRDRRNDMACRAGFIDRCDALLWKLRDCAVWLTTDSAACDRVVTAWRSDPVHRAQLAAYERLDAMCDAGEARACDVIPGRALPDDDLCTAHDYAACATLACFGDDAAGERARRNGASHLAACDRAYRRALQAWHRCGRDEPPPVVADRRDPPERATMQVFVPLVFRERGGRDERGWPRYDVYNLTDQPVVEFTVCVVSYDKDANEVLRVREVVDAAPIPAHGSVRLELGRAGRVPRLGRASWKERIGYEQIRYADGAVAEWPTQCQP